MARRSRAREVALQLLFQCDHNPRVDPEQVRTFIHGRLRDESLEQFAHVLYHGVVEHKADIDRRLSELAENWSVERMATVDRNILRLGAFELLHQPDAPLRVVIDEAVELAKRFGAAESAAFVNGILDRLAATRGPSPDSKPRGESSSPADSV